MLCSIGSKYSEVLQAGILLQARQGSRGERDKWMEATLERLVVRQHAGIYKGQWIIFSVKSPSQNIFCEESFSQPVQVTCCLLLGGLCCATAQVN